jgi:cytochrome c2
MAEAYRPIPRLPFIGSRLPFSAHGSGFVNDDMVASRAMKRIAPAAGVRSDGGAFSGVFWPLWHLAAALIVILAPSHMRLGPFWRLPPDQISQGLLMGAAYLLLALFLWPQRSSRVCLVSAIVATPVFFGAAYLFLLTRPDFSYSRLVILISAGLGLFLASLPFVLGRYRALGLLALAAACTAVVALGIASPGGKTGGLGHLSTALKTLSVTYLRNLLEPVKSDGGAITRYGDGFLLVTGSGEIYRLEWEPGKNALKSTRLPLSAPMDREAFLADRRDAPATQYRVTDIALDTSVTPTRIYLAHQHWNREGKCMTKRVSVAPLSDPAPNVPTPAPPWSTVFESQPCLTVSGLYDGIESGGRLAWTPEGRLLLTLGDHGFNGLTGPPAMAQADNNDYGKVLLLDLAGGREVFTMGHRNPQGLFVDRKGRIWETEHGPQNGDELNLLKRGRNYGWPLLTYGTQYGETSWPIAKPNDGKAYEEPVHAFTPTIAPSNLIEVGPAMFPEWDGDLLVASLRAQSLYRIRLHGDRVVYVEPIKIGRRIRDLEQGTDGRIVLWADGREIIVLAPGEPESKGQRLYGKCVRCHESVAGGNAPAPSLRGIVGKPVASEPGYVYSPALARLGGTWAEERLDAFLRNPAAYVPGTSMVFEGIPDAAERRALIEYLKSYR